MVLEYEFCNQFSVYLDLFIVSFSSIEVVESFYNQFSFLWSFSPFIL